MSLFFREDGTIDPTKIFSASSSLHYSTHLKAPGSLRWIHHIDLPTFSTTTLTLAKSTSPAMSTRESEDQKRLWIWTKSTPAIELLIMCTLDDSSSDSDTLSDFGSELTPSPPSVGDVVCNPAEGQRGREGDKLDIIDQDESDRMFTFEVAQTNEQEESVAVREGFEAVSQVIAHPEVIDDPDSTKPAPIAPFLVHGETAQGFMMVKHQDAKLVRDTFRGRTIEGLQLEGLLASDRLRLNEKLDDEALKILVPWGLEK
ncbi:hypothetical protein L210DRAFT_3639339 [Boletus edulis BED1]|uniref:Uncharacterized protein n=1 Tax=Boletus edulis BED1 TaxID=1328754 RepID=A0AAD4C9G0_BOLED|nr:hypothetical protein L210DRAFT_3639339 [Boletus edulis BED1]